VTVTEQGKQRLIEHYRYGGSDEFAKEGMNIIHPGWLKENKFGMPNLGGLRDLRTADAYGVPQRD
jgi:hypothetical protein